MKKSIIRVRSILGPLLSVATLVAINEALEPGLPQVFVAMAAMLFGISLANSGLGTALAFIYGIVAAYMVNPHLLVLLGPAFLILSAKSMRNWHATSLVAVAFMVATRYQQFDLLAASVLLSGASLVAPVDAAILASLYSFLVTAAIFSSPAQGEVLSRGMIIGVAHGIPSDNFRPTPLEIIKIASQSYSSLLSYLLGKEGVGIIQMLAFGVAGYTSSRILRGGGRRSRILSGLVSSSIIVVVYLASQQIFFGYYMPPDYYVPLLAMAPSFIWLFSRIFMPGRRPIRAKRGELGRTTFQDIGDLEEVKKELIDTIIFPLKNPRVASDYGLRLPRGILLYGPPGCGKTLLMRALAHEAGMNFLYVKSSDILSKWYGESEKRIAELFSEARRSAPCILFFDEFDALGKSRDRYASDDISPKLLSALLAEMDGLSNSDGIIVVGSTNMPELIDPALLRPGRFDKILYVPPPDREARKEIFAVHLRDMPLTEDVDYEALADLTEGYSGADIYAVCQEAARMAARDSAMLGIKRKISTEDLVRAISTVRPSLTPEMLSKFELFASRPRQYRHVMGGDDQLDETRKALMILMTRKDRYLRPILVIGPPGCGKKATIRNVAQILGYGILEPATDMELEKLLTKKFGGKVAIVVDVDVLGENAVKILSSLCRRRRKARKRVVVVSSSRPGLFLQYDMTECLKGVIYVPPPDRGYIAELLRRLSCRVSFTESFNFDMISSKFQGYSLESIKDIISLIEKHYVEMSTRDPNFKVSEADVLDIVRLFNPIPLEVFREIEEFLASYSGPIAGFLETVINVGQE